MYPLHLSRTRAGLDRRDAMERHGMLIGANDAPPRPVAAAATATQSIAQELRELAWLASMILILSIFGVGLAIVVSLTLEGGVAWHRLLSV